MSDGWRSDFHGQCKFAGLVCVPDLKEARFGLVEEQELMMNRRVTP